jgi:hypothetical protein
MLGTLLIQTKLNLKGFKFREKHEFFKISTSI